MAEGGSFKKDMAHLEDAIDKVIECVITKLKMPSSSTVCYKWGESNFNKR